MERNPNEGNQGTGQSGSSSGTSGYGASSGASTSFGSETSGSTGSSGASGTSGSAYGSTGTESKGEKTRDVASEKFGKAKEKAGELKASLADKLEAGAEKLRARSRTGTYAGDTGSGSAAIATDDRLTDVSNRVAGGLQASADWIREADLDSVKSGIETQVKEHPGRTLLIAAGVGYLLGKAFRR